MCPYCMAGVMLAGFLSRAVPLPRVCMDRHLPVNRALWPGEKAMIAERRSGVHLVMPCLGSGSAYPALAVRHGARGLLLSMMMRQANSACGRTSMLSRAAVKIQRACLSFLSWEMSGRARHPRGVDQKLAIEVAQQLGGDRS